MYLKEDKGASPQKSGETASSAWTTIVVPATISTFLCLQGLIDVF